MTWAVVLDDDCAIDELMMQLVITMNCIMNMAEVMVHISNDARLAVAAAGILLSACL